uniref:t-SNARE coiled-coil homology domain-containing protein n=1 Tax=Castor canadensis TaxID=51338 RepID=A0A8C0XFT6_CASCN
MSCGVSFFLPLDYPRGQKSQATARGCSRRLDGALLKHLVGIRVGDLEDLDEIYILSVVLFEANPRKFNLDATELSIRKAFITSTRQIVRDMKDQMSTSSVQALAERKNRQALLGDSGSQNWNTGTTDQYRRLDRELQLANSHFIEEQQAQQQLIVEQQDEQLELVSGSIGVLKNMSQRIGGELEEQAV